MGWKPTPPPPPAHWSDLTPKRINAAHTEQERLDEIKQAYCDDLIDVERMEQDIQFVLEGGYFAGGYRLWVTAPDPGGLPPAERR